MATYKINSQTEVPQLKDSNIGSTLFQTGFSTSIPQHVDLENSQYGNNNPNLLYRFANTIEYIKNNNNVSYTAKQVNNSAKNITIRLDTTAFRNNKFDIANFRFDNNFPEINTYNLCQQNLSVVFKANSKYISKHYNQSTQYPSSNQLQIVKNFNPNSCGGEGDPFCYANEPTFIPVTGNYGSTIYGYAFYVQNIRTVNIPEIGEVEALCAGGHVCCRTEFTPTLIIGSNLIPADSNINLNNVGDCDQSENPIPGFVDMTGYDRSSAFVFNGVDSSQLSDAKFFLSCNLSDCHNGVTMVVLVAQNLDTSEYEIIFSDCVPACLEVNIGTIKVPEGSPIPCEPIDDPTECTPPPPNCDYTEKTFAFVQFTNIDIPLEATGTEELRQDLIDIASSPVTIPFSFVGEPGISADPVVMGSVGSINVIAYFSAVNNGLGYLDISIALNILQTASAYPYIYGINLSHQVAIDDACNFNQGNGQVETGGGISAPFYTGNGNEEVFVSIF